MADADIIIAGAGSAGCALASRLSEDPKLKVLLLEAGPKGGGFMVDMPAGSFKLMGDPKADWRYMTEPDPSADGRTFQWSGGKMLGGSSCINGMVYIRGQRGDYDEWVAAGAKGWSWDEVLPYFIKAEGFEGEASQSHGQLGPLTVSKGRTAHPLTHAFVKACAEIGTPVNPDYCNGEPDGVFPVYNTTVMGQRASTARTYLKPALDRPNLTVMTDVLVDKVLVENGRATGIRVRQNGQVRDLTTTREVIVSAGGVGSPAILLRSGIGPAESLTAIGVDVVLNSPGVGRNLQEQPTAAISKLVDVATYNSPFGPVVMARNMLEYLLFRRGPMTSAAVQAMAYFRSRPDMTETDYCLSFLPMAISFEGLRPGMHPKPGISIGGNLNRPFSRGEIRLKSANPADHPIIDHRLLGDDRDMAAMVAMMRKIAEIYQAPAIKNHVVAENMPSPVPESDADWEAFVRASAGISYHNSCTCSMGDGPNAVSDAQMRVRGVSGLRVIDASAMPNIISGNTNAPTIMMAERGADLIRSELRTA